MKADALLLVDADPVSAELVALAAMKTNHRLLQAQTSPGAFHILESSLHEVDLIVVNVDSGVHGLAVLEALDVSPVGPPVIILTSLKESYMTPVGAAHGAAACLGKPFTLEKLVSVIEQVSAPSWRATSCSSDAWGHPHRCENSFIACPGCRRRAEPAGNLALVNT
jgi:DNA-binding response OmpR family regulator